MNKLLNRFAWVLSLCFGFIVAFTLIGFDTGTIREEDIVLSTIFGLFLGAIIKKLLFSANFIEGRLAHFAKILKEDYIEKDQSLEEVGDTITVVSSRKSENIQEKTKKYQPIILDEQDDISEYTEVERDRNEVEKKASKPHFITKEVEKKIEKVEEIPGVFDIYISKIGEYIKEFFATNTLAKIGGILVFLAVVYFLKGVAGIFWDTIGPVGRLIIGFIVGFSTFGIGTFLHVRGSKNEGLVLIGLSILINYAVILSGRYLIGENMSGGDGFLTEGVTFLLLILNTIFGVVNSLVYNSRTLLIFSFVFAYLNPFIIGADSSGQPYTLIGYSFIVSLGGLFLASPFFDSFANDKKIGKMTLLLVSFILGNLLFLVAPFSDSIGWSSKIILTAILSLLAILITNTGKLFSEEGTNNIIHLFTGAYIFIILHLFNSTYYAHSITDAVGGAFVNVLGELGGFIIYILILAGLFIASIKIIAGSTNRTVHAIFLLFPLFILLGVLFSGQLLFIPFVLIGTLLCYLIGFVFFQNILSNFFAYILFGSLAVFIFLFNLNFTIFGYNEDVSTFGFILLLVTSFVFLFSAYAFSRKKDLTLLYSIGTIGTVLILAPILVIQYDFGDLPLNNSAPQNIVEVGLSLLAVIVFALANWILPFVNKNLLEDRNNIGNLITGSIVGVLFISFMIYSYGEEYFPGVVEGLAFGALAIVYFIQSFFIVQKIGSLSIDEEKSVNSTSLKNIFYTYAGISISLFSLAIAFVFSKYPEVISTVWLFEATILYYFYSKNSDGKLLLAGNILFAIGIFKLGLLLSIVEKEDYQFLVSFGVIATSLVLNVKFIDKIKSVSGNIFHYILHVIGIGILSGLLLEIIVSSGHGWSALGISIFIFIIGIFYSSLKVEFLKGFFVIILGIFAIFHIGSIDSIFWRLGDDNRGYLKILQYVVSAIVIGNYFVWREFNVTKNRNINKIILFIVSIYAFIVSNIYILDIFEEIFGHFSLTIYWGVLASVLLFYGIANDILKFRTVGLYFIMLTSAKVFLFDIWQLGNTSSRVIAFMGLGILFIVISTFYTKRFGNNILGELSLDNLKEGDTAERLVSESYSDVSQSGEMEKEKSERKTVQKKLKKTEKVENGKDLSFMEKLESVQADDIRVVRFSPKSGENFTIRAKNLVRLSKLVINQTGKTQFGAGELGDIYNYVVKNYKSNLSRREYDKLRSTLKNFIDEGGEVEIVKK